MVWVNIKRIDNSKLNDSKIVVFDYFDKECFSIVSKKVLKFLGIESLENISQLFVLKTFKNNKPIYLIKKVR